LTRTFARDASGIPGPFLKEFLWVTFLGEALGKILISFLHRRAAALGFLLFSVSIPRTLLSRFLSLTALP